MKFGFQKPNRTLNKLSFASSSDRIVKEFSRIVCVSLFSYQCSLLLTVSRQLIYFTTSSFVCQQLFWSFSNSLKMKFCHPCWRLDYFIISSYICQHLFYLFFASFLLCHTILYTHFFEACFSIPFLSTLRQAPFCINFSDTFAAFYMAYCILQIPSSHCNI